MGGGVGQTSVPPCAHDVESWARHYAGTLTILLHRRRHARGLSEDVLQDLWLSLLRAPPPEAVATDPHRLSAWLVGAARRRLSDYARKEARRREVPLADHPSVVVGDEVESDCQELAERVQTVLANLAASGSAESARLLRLRFIEGRSTAEIGEVLGVSPRVVSTRLQRAKRRFRREWRSGGGVRRAWSDRHRWSRVRHRMRGRRFFRDTFSRAERLYGWRRPSIRAVFGEHDVTSLPLCSRPPPVHGRHPRC
jgi:RNA polymerase sigma factor (sigma-70 family)